MTQTSQLRALLRGGDMVIAPGAYDGIAARPDALAEVEVIAAASQ